MEILFVVEFNEPIASGLARLLVDYNPDSADFAIDLEGLLQRALCGLESQVGHEEGTPLVPLDAWIVVGVPYKTYGQPSGLERIAFHVGAGKHQEAAGRRRMGLSKYVRACVSKSFED